MFQRPGVVPSQSLLQSEGNESSLDYYGPNYLSENYEVMETEQNMINHVHTEVDNTHLVPLKVARLYGDESSDVCLVVGDKKYNAHRTILCMSSKVFKEMLMNNKWSEVHQSIVRLHETKDCCAVFEQFLQYFYTAHIKFNYITIMPLLMLADKYIVTDLVESCVEYMCDNVVYAALNKKLIAWLQFTLNLGHYKVSQACENFVKWNFEWVSKETDFLDISLAHLERVLQQNDLVVYDEMTVYKIAIRWLESVKTNLSNSTGEDFDHTMKIIIKRVMIHVRFPMMTHRQLAELFLYPDPIYKNYEFIQSRLAVGMSFHSSTECWRPSHDADMLERLKQTSNGGMEHYQLQFTPRLYTADKWCSELTVENYPELPLYVPHTLIFSTYITTADYNCDQTFECDWVIDLFPKGVWFGKFIMIWWEGNKEVPESIVQTVRVTIKCRGPPSGGLKANIGVLVKVICDDLEHIIVVRQATYRFFEGDNVLNLENIFPFDLLNSLKKPRFLVGPNKDKLQVNFVITPLSELASPHMLAPPMNVWVRS